MRSFLLNHFELASLGEMPVTAAGDRRGQYGPPILKEIRFLLLQIDLDRSFSVRQSGGADKDRETEEGPHVAFKPVHCGKVARSRNENLDGDWRFD